MQGTSTNSEHDIGIIVEEDLAALAAFLGDQRYFFGDTPSVTDATVFGFLEAPLYDGLKSPVGAALQKHANLVRFIDSIREEYFADRLAKFNQSKKAK